MRKEQVMRNRYVAGGALLLLAGMALGQINPYGGERNGPPPTAVRGGLGNPAEQVAQQGVGGIITGGGDFVFSGPIAVVDAQGRLKTFNGLHRYSKPTGLVETFVIKINGGRGVGSWRPAVDVAVGVP
jgi:hypothetical protein